MRTPKSQRLYRVSFVSADGKDRRTTLLQGTQPEQRLQLADLNLGAGPWYQSYARLDPETGQYLDIHPAKGWVIARNQSEAIPCGVPVITPTGLFGRITGVKRKHSTKLMYYVRLNGDKGPNVMFWEDEIKEAEGE